MAFIIRDEAVSALASELQEAFNLPSKTDAVRLALQHELARVRRVTALHGRIAKSQGIAQAIGTCDADFDMKTFTDEMWDGL
ncbi:MAG: type II toxin-antitoxin system VapB family antitoxin [Allorhizobium sp.]